MSTRSKTTTLAAAALVATAGVIATGPAANASAEPIEIKVSIAFTDSRLDWANDVAAAFPGWGPGHGYSLSVAARPGQRVCSYAINTLQGSDNTTLGCRTA